MAHDRMQAPCLSSNFWTGGYSASAREERRPNLPTKRSRRWAPVELCVAILALAVAACGPTVTRNGDDLDSSDLATETTRGVYTTGYELGRNLREQGVEVDAAALIRGLIDGLEDRQPLLSDAEMHEAMLQLGQELDRRQQEQLAAHGERNLTEGAAFLESNRGRPGVVTLPSGLQYEVIRPGSDVRPGAADEVTVHYEGKLIDGTVFNTSYGLGRPMEATVSELIPGWQEALLLMGEGARWTIFLPPQLAYGDRSPSPLVGPNAALIFDLELIAVRSR